MLSFGNIVIYHPAAIGDAMLASPIAAVLKLNFPAAKITYWSHPELRPLLLGLSPNVDEFVDYSRESGFFDIVRQIERLKPDLFVDLSNSTKTKMLPWFTRVRIVRYRKQHQGAEPIQHAVHNFLETITPICAEYPEQLFPSIFPAALTSEVMEKVLKGGEPRPFIGIVPGVGRHRPHRAWIPDGWVYLLRHLIDRGTHWPVLIGGPDDAPVAERILEELEAGCLNAVGELTLAQTATVLKNCQVVISGDTGPAHLAVAVGTRVIGLYGPTFPARSGPYECGDLTLDQSPACKCHGARSCKVSRPDMPGECMHRIMLPEIIEKVELVIGRHEKPEAERSSDMAQGEARDGKA